MTTQLDELNDEELEASLLWTDDEGENEVIDPSDEEFLLNDCASRSNTPESATEDLIDSDNNEDQCSIIKDNNDQQIHDDIKITSDNILVGPCTCDTEEVVDLDVTFNTRDMLENSSFLSDDESVLEKTITNDTNDHELNEVIAASSINPIITIDQFESKSDFPPEEITKTPPQTDELLHKTLHSEVDVDINSLSSQIPHISQQTNEIPKVYGKKDDISEQSKIPSEDQLTDILKTPTTPSPAPESGVIVVTSDLIPPVVDNNINKLPFEVKNTDTEQDKNSNDSPDHTITVDDAIKSIRQAVAKRAKSHSDEDTPIEKRHCSSADSPNLDQECLDSNLQNSVKNSSSSTTAVPSHPCNELVECNKKRPIVTFNFKNYSKNFATDPYDCKTCSMKFKDELKFESHLIASHAMSLIINDFDIDLHQYYKQKKEKVITQCKSTLPKITPQDGNIDMALIKEYNQNVKLFPAQKNAQYFCKICENVYSTKNLIIGHLKSSKHILRKGK